MQPRPLSSARTGLSFLLLLHVGTFTRAQDLSTVCAHENLPNVGPAQEIADGQTVYSSIRTNQTHRWFYRSYNVTTMNQPDPYRKLIINLEPCRGTVYLFVRKTRRCYPNPYSCIDLNPQGNGRQPSLCTWTHFMSDISGAYDGTPTFFEVPLSTTQYFISIYAPENADYTLTILADIGAFPRPGNNGRITARQIGDLKVQLAWNESVFFPQGISSVSQYWVYSALLLDSDNRTNPVQFLRPSKIMNTVCGLENNTDRPLQQMPSNLCSGGLCVTTVDGVVPDKQFVFNIVAQSARGFRMAYSGLIMRTTEVLVVQSNGPGGSVVVQVDKSLASDKTLKVVGAVSGSVMGMVVIIYFLMLKLYG